MNFATFQRITIKITSRNDILLALFLVAIVFMMILPMPTILVDTLIAINISIAIILLMVAVYIPSPLSFSAFPAVLLLTTLFRLALSITTTRLILLEADAGKIVYTFGDFVIAGNIVVGLVVFLIITLVQFIVITKGSERVAEVSARFSLDALPGKQMSIDGDMRAGVITMDQARKRRGALEKESQLYGAMDGAMKFVKGDAIAGILIIIVNILGGISIGVMQQGMSAGEAMQLYAVLTVGDGLVSQIPAIFIAITAGLIVTRVTTDESKNLGADIGNQILAQPTAMLVGSGLLIVMGLIPGFPTVIFVILGLTLGGVAWVMHKLKQKKEKGYLNIQSHGEGDESDSSIQPDKTADGLSASSPVLLEVAEAARFSLAPELLNTELAQVRQALFQELGVPFPNVNLRFERALNEDGYSIYLHEIPVARGRFGIEQVYVRHSAEELQLLDVPFDEGDSFLPGLPAIWVGREYEDTLRGHGVEVLTPPQILCLHLAHVLRQHASQFMGIQETHKLLETMESNYAELIKETLRTIPLPKVADVLRRLVAEDISIRDLRTIMEGLVEWGQQEKDPVVLTEYVRSNLKRQISHRFCSGQNILPALIVHPTTEDALRGGMRQTPSGAYIALEPDVSSHLMDTIRENLGGVDHASTRPVLLTSLDIRRHLRKLIEIDFQELPVLSYQELEPNITVQPLGQIRLA